MKINFKFRSINFFAYLVIFLFIVYFSYLSVARHLALKTYQNDLGVYSQLTWNTLQGRFFEASGAMLQVTLNSYYTTDEHFNYLSAHFSPLLIIFAPLYAIWSDPRLFLIIQALLVGLSALPIYWLAREKLKSALAGLLLLLSYLFYPIINNALLYDFHEVTFGAPLVTFALWFFYKKKIGPMLICLFLLLLLQEQASLIVLMFGVYLMIKKNLKLGLAISVIALGYFILVVFYLMPLFSAAGEVVLFKDRYGWLGQNFSEAFRTIIREPLTVLKAMLGFRQLEFLSIMLMPLLYLPLLSGLFILALPIILINFLSKINMTYSVYFYHSAIIIGIIYLAIINVLARLFKNPLIQKILLGLILISTLIFSYFYSLTPLAKKYHWSDYHISDNAKLIKEVKKLIPDSAALSIQNNLGPHFANRQKLFHFPYMLEQADYVILDINDPYAANQQAVFKFNSALMGEQNFNLQYFDWWFSSVGQMFKRPDFGIIYSQDGWLVFQKGAGQQLNDQAQLEFQKKFAEILDDNNLKLQE